MSPEHEMTDHPSYIALQKMVSHHKPFISCLADPVFSTWSSLNILLREVKEATVSSIVGVSVDLTSTC